MEPTFDEFCNTSLNDSQPNFFQSWMVVLAMVSWPFSAQMRSSGRTTPSSSAAAARITLNVDPGSNGSVTARVTAHDGAARRAGEGLVPRALDTLQAAVHALEAEHVRRELTVGIQAQRLVEEAEPRLVQRTHARGDCRRQLATEPHEAFAGCELRMQVARGDIDDRRQRRRQPHRI